MDCAIVSNMAEEQKLDSRLIEGVAYFEQMLQLMPEDRETLEFLAVAYGQLGRKEDAERTIVSLAKILVRDRDLTALEGLLPWLEAGETPEAKALVLKVRTMVAPAPDLTPEAPPELTPEDTERLVKSRTFAASERSLQAFFSIR